MYCCARCVVHCQYSNKVQFKKLKPKYSLDEDIVVEYTLQDNYCPGIPDWIGIFPRGCSSLQQHLTFEYVVTSQKLSPTINHRIVFMHTFHREALPNTDYQFVYVSADIKILGTSSYFRFVASPCLRSLDRKPDMPEIVNEARSSSILSPKAAETDKILAKSRSIDNIIESQFSDQSRSTCRAYCNSRFDSSYTNNKTQLLLLLNEQLMARVGRLDRDLELAKATLKNERMARNTLTKKLQTYETFVGEMLRCLNIMGVVKIKDNTGGEITIQKMKSKDVSSLCYKSISIPEVPMLYKNCNDETTLKINKIEGFPQELESFLNEAFKNEVMDVHNSENDKEKLEEEASMSVPKTEKDFLNQRDCCVTKEATSAINQHEDNKVDFKIEDDQVEDKVNETGSDVDTDKKCCCDCHSNITKESGDEPKFDENNLHELILEGECYLKMYQGMHQIQKNLANCLRMSTDTENKSNQESLQPRTSTILINCRNPKFSVIK